MRLHSACSTDSKSCEGSPSEPNPLPIVPHFPFLYGDEAAHAMRKAIEMRYRLIPMLYSLGHEAYQTGAPITRPLLMEFSSELTANITDQWLLGPDLMVAPVYSEKGARSIHFPKLSRGQVWYEFASTRRHRGGSEKQVVVPLDEAPMYCRSGALVPLGPVVQHTGELPGPDGTLEMHVYSGRDGSFAFVEDDGESRDYEQGTVRKTTFAWNDERQLLTWSVSNGATHKSMFRHVAVKLFSKIGMQEARGELLGRAGSVSFEADLFV